MQSRLESLAALGISTEFHAYSGLPHGFGLGTGTVAEGWIDDAVNFWQAQSGSSGVVQVRADSRPNDGRIYSIDGRRLAAIQPGINIVNGKKILAK